LQCGLYRLELDLGVHEAKIGSYVPAVKRLGGLDKAIDVLRRHRLRSISRRRRVPLSMERRRPTFTFDTPELDEQRACRLAFARRLLLRKAITPPPTGRVTAWATKESRER
jgi:hypothetical protein